MPDQYNPMKSAEIAAEHNYNMIDGVLNNQFPPPEPEKELDKVKEPPQQAQEPGTGGAVTKKRVRSVPVHVWVRPDELEAIQGRMAEAGIHNMSAYMRKMALNGYVLNIDLAPVQELVSLQRRCANNLNQVAIQANTYGGIYPEEIKALQRDYAALWEPLADLLKKLAAVVEL